LIDPLEAFLEELLLEVLLEVFLWAAGWRKLGVAVRIFVMKMEEVVKLMWRIYLW
jgi:hypothetical protein